MPEDKRTDPRVLRSREAIVDAARILFLRNGYAATTMEQIAAQAGRTKRTVYNNFADKSALFTRIVSDVIVYAEDFARALDVEFESGLTPANLSSALHDLGVRLALAIARPDVIALRRLLIAEAREFPELAPDYYRRAPGAVIRSLASAFARLAHGGLLSLDQMPEKAARSGRKGKAADRAAAHRAASQFAYLVVGEQLDRATLTGWQPGRAQVLESARDGVRTFMARYEVRSARSRKRI